MSVRPLTFVFLTILILVPQARSHAQGRLAQLEDQNRRAISTCFFQQHAMNSFEMRACTGGLWVDTQTFYSCINGGWCLPSNVANLSRGSYAPLGVRAPSAPPPGWRPPGADQQGVFLPPIIPTEESVADCRTENSDDDDFVGCVARAGMLPSQQKVYDCYKDNKDDGPSFAACAVEGRISNRQEEALRCLVDNRNSVDDLTECAGASFLGRNAQIVECAKSNDEAGDIAQCIGSSYLSPDQRHLVECYRANSDSVADFAGCAGSRYVPGEIGRAIGCLSENGDAMGTAVCMASDKLTPEQSIILSCAASTGGQPIAFAGCAGGRLTAREITKCLENGVGGDSGCFGPNNDIIKTVNNVNNDLQHGLGPNNDIRRNFENVQHDLQHGPGPNNDVRRNLSNAANDLQHGLGPNNEIRKVLTPLGNLMPKLF